MAEPLIQDATRSHIFRHGTQGQEMMSQTISIVIILAFLTTGTLFWFKHPHLSHSYPVPAYEAEAIYSLKKYMTAQYDYMKNDLDGNGTHDFAPNLLFLKNALPPEKRPPREVFNLTNKASPDVHYYYVPLYYDSTGKQITPFLLCAIPVRYGEEAQNTYLIGPSGKVYFIDNGGTAISVFPEDPLRVGWYEY